MLVFNSLSGQEVDKFWSAGHNIGMVSNNSHLMNASQPPPEFVRLLRDALLHINNPAYLLRHPLNNLLSDLLPEGTDPAQGLRELLLDAIEGLEPPGGSSSAEQTRRPYLALVYRYLDGFGGEEIARRLHIGPRQFRRELHQGLNALAVLLWSRRGGPAPARHPEPEPQAAVLAEVAALGVEIERVSLAEILEALRPAALALAARYGATLSLPPAAGQARCFCDRTLTKQALISCLSAILSRSVTGPLSLQIKPATRAGALGLEINFLPALPQEEQASLLTDLAECRALLSGQGGSASILRQESGGCSAVWVQLGLERAVRIFVVDDNEGMRQLYERYLSAGRFLVRFAASASEAEALLEESIPDAIILDVMMRGLDGWDLLQALRARPELQGTPVIVCSVLKEPGLAFSLGAQAYLKKPITGEELLRALSDALGQSNPQGLPPRWR